MVTLQTAMRRPSIPWRTVVVIVLAKAAWDTVGMLIGDSAYESGAYDVLRSLPPVGGMRARGVAFAALTVASFVAARHAVRSGRARTLRLCLTGLAVWYAGWAAGLLSAWMVHEQIFGWSAPASVVVVAVLALAAARAAPSQVRR